VANQPPFIPEFIFWPRSNDVRAREAAEQHNIPSRGAFGYIRFAEEQAG